MKNSLLKAGSYLLDFVAAMWIGMLGTFPLEFPLGLLCDLTLLQNRIWHGIAQAVFTIAWLFLSARAIGYKEKEFHPAQTLFSVLIVFIVQAIVCYPMHFVMYVSGATYYFTEAIHWGNSSYPWQDWGDAPLLLRYGLILLFDLIHMIAILAGEYFGAQKRQKERSELIRK